MRIIKVIVDRLPESALACDFANHEWEYVSGKVLVECECDHAQCRMSKVAFITRRCSVCPLVEEAEEEQKNE